MRAHSIESMGPGWAQLCCTREKSKWFSAHYSARFHLASSFSRLVCNDVPSLAFSATFRRKFLIQPYLRPVINYSSSHVMSSLLQWMRCCSARDWSAPRSGEFNVRLLSGMKRSSSLPTRWRKWSRRAPTKPPSTAGRWLTGAFACPSKAAYLLPMP